MERPSCPHCASGYAELCWIRFAILNLGFRGKECLVCGFLGRITRTGPSSPFGSSFIVGGCIACLIIHCVCQYNTVHGGHTGRHEGGGSGVSIVGDGRDAQRREHVAEEDARRRFFDADVAVAVAVRTSRRHPHRHVLRQRMGLFFFAFVHSFNQSLNRKSFFLRTV